jgi:hypothetical protein
MGVPGRCSAAMKALSLAISIWCGAFGAVLLALITTGSGDPNIIGLIVLDYKPFCSSFIVQTLRGFAFLTWEDGILVFAEGDTVRGPLHTRGDQSVDLVGHGAMAVRVEGWSPDFQSAQEILRRRCDLSTDTALILGANH